MSVDKMDPRIPLGEDAYYSPVYDHNGQWVGIYEWHRCSANPAPGLHGDGLTAGWIQFAIGDVLPPAWELLQREPLTLGGSLLCRACGRHGFIRDGRWVPA